MKNITIIFNNNYVKNFSTYLYSIDIDPSRKPDQILDLMDPNFCQNYLGEKVNLVCMFEVLEHTKNPSVAIKNIYNLLIIHFDNIYYIEYI